MLSMNMLQYSQAACKKKVVSKSPRLVDFAIGLQNFILNLTDTWGYNLRQNC